MCFLNTFYPSVFRPGATIKNKMLQSGFRICRSRQKNTVRQIVRCMASMPPPYTEKYSWSFERRKSNYIIATTNGVSKETPRLLSLIPFSQRFSPWQRTHSAFFNETCRFFSSLPGNGSNDNGDSPEDSPSGNVKDLHI